MRLFLLLVSLAFCCAKVDEGMQKKIDEILPAIKNLASGAPDDWSVKDRKSFDQFIGDIVKGKLLTITEELAKLKKRSSKAYDMIAPLAIYFKNGFDKLKSVEGRKYFVTEIPALTSEGIGFGDMMSIVFDFWQMSAPTKDEIYRVFPEMFEKSSYQTMVTPSGVLLYVVCFCSMSLIMFFTLTPSALREKLTEPILVTRKKTKMTIFPSTRTTRSPNSYLLTPTERVNKNITISIIIVYTHGTPLEKYETALNSVECYAKLHSYPFYLFSDTKYEQCRKHKDLFFRRHCCIVRFMESQLAPDSWLLVLDGDIAVVNPNILIDTYIDPNYDITLFDRFFNFEVGANSYLVKNTKLGREFACGFADYELKLPKSFHGTDNGALHPYLVELLAPENVRLSSLCKEIWRKSTGYATLFEMEACTRLILGDRINYSEHKLRILPKGKAWVRDLWLLRSRWAEDDFMVHAVKEEQLDTNRTDNRQLPDDELYQWDPTNGNMRTFPLLRKLDISKCERGEEQWHYDSRLKITNEKKKKLLDYMERKILRKRLETIGRIAQRL